jgi:hypothetical protein
MFMGTGRRVKPDISSLPGILEKIKIEKSKYTKYKVNSSLGLIKHHTIRTYGE